MKQIVISMLIAGVLIGGAMWLAAPKSDWDPNQGPTENVSVVEGIQYVDIKAKGGYLPRISYAQSGIPTVLRVQTNNTFDCSSALVIPSLKYRGNLAPSGVEEIELPPQEKGSSHKGLCSMGMYGFEVRFN